MLSSVPSGTTSGSPPTGGAPRTELSSTARPTCQRLSPGQPTCDGKRKADSHEAGPGAAGPRHNCPRQNHFLRVLWTGQAEVLHPCQEPGEGQEDLHWGLPVWRTSGSPAGAPEIRSFFPVFWGILPHPTAHGPAGISTNSRYETMDSGSPRNAASAQTIRFSTFLTPDQASLSHPNSPTVSASSPAPPPPHNPTLPTFMFLLKLAQPCSL